MSGNAQLTANTAFSATNWVYFTTQAGGSINLGTAAAWRIMVIRCNSASSLDLYADGGTATNCDPNDLVTSSTTLALGGSGADTNAADVDYGMVLRYDSALVAADINTLGSGLASLFATTWTTAT
jgi:hypothetical protein